MAPRDFAKMTSPGAESHLTGAVVFLPLGATEPHGPHLPLSTDTILAEEAARRAAAFLLRLGVKSVVAPAIPFAVTEFSEGFPGRVSIPEDVAKAYIRETAASLAGGGAVKVILVTFHFEPGHLRSVRGAVDECQQRALPVHFVDFTKRKFAARIGGEFATGSCHAGSFESSLVLAARHELVDEIRRATLPELWISLPDKMREGARNFRECGMDAGYCGNPAAASAAEGERLFALLTEILAEAATP